MIKRYVYCIVWLSALTMVTGCKKEASLQPSGEEKNYLVVPDNPADPVDHARYEFYKGTGLPVYYNDTIAREQVGEIAGVPQYAYHRLALAYSPAGLDKRVTYKLLTEKEIVLPILPLLQTFLIPKIPVGISLHSLLLVESIRKGGTGQSAVRLNKPYIGFNTVAIKALDPDTMTAESQQRYMGTILAALALNKLLSEYSAQLNANFYSISDNSVPSGQAYGVHLSELSPDFSLKLEDFGFINSHPNDIELSPYRQDDLLSFLEAVFFDETSKDFEASYSAYPLVINKFRIVRNMAKDLGFQFAD